MHANNAFSIRIISLYVSQPSFGVFACKTSTLGPKLQVSMIRRSHQWFFAFKTASLAPELQVSMGPSPHLWCMENNENSIRITSLYGSQTSSVVFASKTTTLGTELQVSMGPSRHLLFFTYKTVPLASELPFSMGPSSLLWFFQAKQRLLDQNYKSLWVPDLTCRFVHSKQRD